jgi:uncharacterized DUF497 family protein
MGRFYFRGAFWGARSVPLASEYCYGACIFRQGLDRMYIHMYSDNMRFAWDRKKSDANYRERGFDFAFASLVFDGPILMVEDARREYGERRFVAIGLADQIHITLVFTDRTGSKNDIIRRIISARRSSRKERKLYDQTCR